MTDTDPTREVRTNFGAEPVWEHRIESVLQRAQTSEDAELRRALKQLQALLWLSLVTLGRSEENDRGRA